MLIISHFDFWPKMVAPTGRHASSMRPVPLINAEHALRVAGLLDAAGVPADRYLERAKASPRIRENPGGFVPGRSVWSLIANTTRAVGLENLWLDVARSCD
jgi:hypothetical protein